MRPARRSTANRFTNQPGCPTGHTGVKMESKNKSFRIPLPLLAKVQQQAKKEGRTFSNMMLVIIRSFFNQ